MYKKRQECFAMSSPFLFYLRTVPSSVIIGRGFGFHMVPALPLLCQSIQFFRQSTSFSKGCASPIKLTQLCYHPLSCALSGTINFRQARYVAAPSSLLAGVGSNMRRYHTKPRATKASMLSRWGTWSSYRNIRQKQINKYFSLGYVFRMFDGIFFHGLLRQCVKLEWQTPTGKLDCLSRTMISDTRRGPCILIEIMEPLTYGPWTFAVLQRRLEDLLYEMTQVFFLMICRDCVPSQRSSKRAASGLRSKYGSSFEKLLREVKQEANRSLKGLPRPWNLRR